MAVKMNAVIRILLKTNKAVMTVAAKVLTLIYLKKCGIQPNMLKNKIQLRVNCVFIRKTSQVQKQSPAGVLQKSYSKIPQNSEENVVVFLLTKFQAAIFFVTFPVSFPVNSFQRFASANKEESPVGLTNRIGNTHL